MESKGRWNRVSKVWSCTCRALSFDGALSVLHNHHGGLRETIPYIIDEDLHAMIKASPHNTHKLILSRDGAVAQAI